MLKEEDNATSPPPKTKNPLPESLRSDLAASRCQIAQVELCSHSGIAFDLLAFCVAARAFDERSRPEELEIAFNRPRVKLRDGHQSTPATRALEEIAKSLPKGWLKPNSETARFDAFRMLQLSEKLDLLSYCLAMTLEPRLGPAEGGTPTAYDAAHALTEGRVADYWRPAKDNFLSRISRDQLLALGRNTVGEQWSQARAAEKKRRLVEQLDRAFVDPAKYARTPEQVKKPRPGFLPA